jgi:hypothetical protein
MFEGQVIVGIVTSNTVMFCVQVAVFPLTSVTVQTTAVVPDGYVPDALSVLLKLLVIDATPQLSLIIPGILQLEQL